jgi:hypothetical protein
MHRAWLLAALRADVEHLPAAVGAAVGAGPMGHMEPMALRAAAQVGWCDAMMLAAVALAMIRETFLGKCAHGVYSSAVLPPAS